MFIVANPLCNLLEFHFMSSHEGEGVHVPNFMTPAEFNYVWNVHVIAAFLEDDPEHPNGSYQKKVVKVGREDLSPAYRIFIPRTLDTQGIVVAFLRQVELVRREVNGLPGLPEDEDARLIAQVELEMSAARFYSLNRLIVDKAIVDDDMGFDPRERTVIRPEDVWPEEGV